MAEVPDGGQSDNPIYAANVSLFVGRDYECHGSSWATQCMQRIVRVARFVL